MASRQQFYLTEFCPLFLLHTNPFLANITLEEKHNIMGAYAIYLALGNNLVCRSIKSDTIGKYISAIGRLFNDKGLLDPAKTLSGKLAKNIDNIIKE